MSRRPRVSARLGELHDGMQRTKLEIPFGHAFDKRGVSSSKSAGARPRPVLDQPSRSAPYNTVPPITTIFICGTVRQQTNKEQFSDRLAWSGIPADLARDGVWDRDSPV